MKKFLFSLLMFFALSVQAMVEETVVFNFADLTSLNVSPALTQAEIKKITDVEAGIGLNVTSRTFTAGAASLSFPGEVLSSGAGLAHYGGAFYLNIGPFTQLKFVVSGGCVLSSVTFSSSLGIYEVSAGRINSSRTVWESQDDVVSEVTMKAGNNIYKLQTITVKYQRPATPLNLLSNTPVSGETVSGSFSSMSLQFSTSVTKINTTSSITLTGTDVSNTSIKQTMSASASEQTVTLTTTPAIEKDASLIVHVPAGVFENAEGAANKAIDIPLTVKEKRDTFNPTQIDPGSQTLIELPDSIQLKFSNFVKIGTGVVNFVPKSGTEGESFPAELSVDPDNQKIAYIKHSYGSIKEAGTWEVQVPEGVFHNPYYLVDATNDRWNAAFTLTYTVDGSLESETMKAAKALLKLTGAGYPKITSTAWQTLNDLVNADPVTADDALAAAMTNLYNETDIEMPAVDTWYKIAGINAEGKKIYLTFNEDTTKVELGTNANTAAAFKVKSISSGVVVMQTKGGLYLPILHTLPNYTGTAKNSLLAEENKYANLTFAHFGADQVIGADSKALYGTFSIFGSIGTKNEVEASAYQALSFDDNNIDYITDPGEPLKFSKNESSAFLLIETTEPSEPKDIVYPRIGFRPSIISSAGDKIELVINGPASTSIADASLIYYTKSTTDADNDKKVPFADTILTPTENANTFNVNTAGLAAGDYNLVMEKGAFNFVAPEGKSIVNGYLTGIIYIQNSSQVTVKPSASLSNSALKSAGDEVILKIGNVKKAIMTATAAPYFQYADGEHSGEKVAFTETILTPIDDSDNTFYVNTKGLKNGKYNLVLPKGTFTYMASEEGVIVVDTEMTSPFAILEVTPIEAFNESYTNFIVITTKYRNKNNILTIADVDLNDFVICAYSFMGYSALYGNPKGKVYARRTYGGDVVTGHFETYDNTELVQKYGDEYNDAWALKFVPDEPIKAGDLNDRAGEYSYYADVAAFGDANFREYLAGNEYIEMTDCVVNPTMRLATYYLNNKEATGIRNVSADDMTEKMIYDMQGRRVIDTSKKGVYIINGRKVVVK